MEVKIVNGQLSSSPSLDSPKNDNSRGMKFLQYLTRTVSGNGSKDSSISRKEVGLVGSHEDDASDSEDGDEDMHNTQGNEGAYKWFLRRKNVVEVSKGFAADIYKSSFGRLPQMKSLLIHKLSSMPHIPADTLEHTRHSIESIVWDATHSAYGKTKEAMHRIRLKLVEVLPSLSPSDTKKIMDDVEREMTDSSKATTSKEIGMPNEEKPKKEGATGILGITGNMGRFRQWNLLRSRL